MRPAASSHVRLARPSADLAAARRFWADGLGLEVLWRTGDDLAEGEHALVMLGWPRAAWHLELVDDPVSAAANPPGQEDLLMLYLGGPVDEDVVSALVTAGGRQVASRNPYWDHNGVTLVDPDGYHLVLSHRTWP